MSGTFRQFEILVAVCERGGFAAAADHLGISQAAVSRQIAALERALGKPLFLRRTGHANRLSSEGEGVLASALIMLEQGRQIGLMGAERRQRVRIGADQIILNMIFQPMMAQMAALKERYDIHFVPVELAYAPEEQLQALDLDLLYFTLGADDPAPQRAISVFTQDNSLFIAPNLWAQIGGDSSLPVILPPAGSRSAGAIEGLLRRRLDKPFHIAAHVEPGAATELLITGIGAGMMGVQRAAPLAQAGLMIEVPVFRGPVQVSRFQLVRLGAPPHVRTVADHLRQAFAVKR